MVRRIGTQVLIPRRLTRTERVIQTRQQQQYLAAVAQQQRQQQQLEVAREKISAMSLEEYERYYPTLPIWMKPSFKTPQQIKATPEYQSYLVQKVQYQKQLSKYQTAKREAEEWRQAYKWHGEWGWTYQPARVVKKIEMIIRSEEVAAKQYQTVQQEIEPEKLETPTIEQAKIEPQKREWIDVLKKHIFTIAGVPIPKIWRDIQKLPPSPAVVPEIAKGYKPTPITYDIPKPLLTLPPPTLEVPDIARGERYAEAIAYARPEKPFWEVFPPRKEIPAIARGKIYERAVALKEKPQVLFPLLEPYEREKAIERRAREKYKALEKAIPELKIAKTLEQQERLITELKAEGITIKEKEGIYTFEVPEEKYDLRPAWREKKVEEMFVPWFLRKLRKGVGETYAELYQRAVFKGATIAEPAKPVVITREAEKFGKAIAIGFEAGLYTVPVVGATALVGGTAEAAIKGDIKQFVKEEPWEIVKAASYGAIKGIQYAREPVRYWVKKPVVKEPVALQELTIKRELASIKKLMLQVKRTGGRYAVQPRWKVWFKKPPISKELFYIKPQTYRMLVTEPMWAYKGKILGDPTVSLYRKGAKYMTLAQLKGRGWLVTKKEWGLLTKLQKFELKVSAQKIFKLKKPPTEKRLYELLRAKEVSLGEAELKKIVRLYGYKVPKVLPYGKRITRVETATIMERKFAVYMKETEVGFAKFVGKTTVKDITYPFARAVGKPLTIKEISKVIGDIRIEPFAKTLKELGYVPPVKIKPTPWKVHFKPTKDFTEQIVRQAKLTGEGKELILTKVAEPIRHELYSIVQMQKDIAAGTYGVKGALGAAEMAMVRTIPRVGLPALITKPVMDVKALIKLTETLIPKEIIKVMPKEVEKIIPKEIVKVMPKLVPKVVTKITPKVVEKIVSKIIAKTIPKIVTKVVPKVPAKIIPTVPPTLKIPLPKIPFIPVIPLLPDIKKLLKIPPVAKSYHVYGKPIRKKKYVRLNKVPLTKEDARSLGAFMTDTSLSTNFLLKESVKLPKEPKMIFPKGYGIATAHKFRSYRIKKGKRIPMKDKWIEKLGLPRLDTEQEIKKLGLLARVAEVERRAGIRKPRKKRKKSKKKKSKRLKGGKK